MAGAAIHFMRDIIYVKSLPVRCLFRFSSAAPPPIGDRDSSPLCTTIKPASPSPLATLHGQHSQRSHLFCHTVSSPPRPLDSVPGPQCPPCIACGVQSPPSDL